MARRTPCTSQEERLERLIRNAQLKIVALKTMVDTAERIVAAQSLEVGDTDDPRVIEISEGGGLALGVGSPMGVIGAITEEVSHTGDTNETELGKITMPADSMGANGAIRVFASYRAIGVGTHTFRAYFGGALFMQYANASTNLMLDVAQKYVWNRGATNSQGSGVQMGNNLAKAGEAPFSGAIDTTADVDITFTVQNAVAGHTGYLRLALVEAFYSD